MRQMVVRTLRMSGVPLGSVFEAGNGEEGLRVLQEEWVDLLLLDINMPVMNGEEMLRRLRANPDTEQLPVIVVSTEGSEVRLAALQELGASIVRKPFAPETLRDTILRVTGVTDVEYYGAVPVASDDSDF
jgi:two-component system chemotaxis response regulator CheY